MTQSLESSEPEPPTKAIAAPVTLPSEEQKLRRVKKPSVNDLQVQALQGRLADLEDKRLEERFLWLCGCGLLFLTVVFMGAGAVGGTVVSLIVLAMLLVLARRWGFEDLWEAVYTARHLLSKAAKVDKDEKKED